MVIDIRLAIIIVVLVGMICFFIGLTIGSSGKSSETERADFAVEKAKDYQKRIEELEKIDLLR